MSKLWLLSQPTNGEKILYKVYPASPEADKDEEILRDYFQLDVRNNSVLKFDSTDDSTAI